MQIKQRKYTLPTRWQEIEAKELISHLVSLYTQNSLKVCRDIWFKETQGYRLCCPLSALSIPYEIVWGDGAAVENLWVWTYGKTFVRGFTDGVDPEQVPMIESEDYNAAFKLGLVVGIETLERVGGE